MQKVAIVGDTTCDVPVELARELGIELAPLAVITDGVEHVTEPGIDVPALYGAMKAANKVSTAAANVEGFVAACERALQRADSVLCLCLAHQLSSTVNNARLAAQMLEDKPVRVVDTLSAIFGQGAIVLEAARRARDGADLDGLAAWAEEAAARSVSYFASPNLGILQGIGRLTGSEEAAAQAAEGARYALVRIKGGPFLPFAGAKDEEEAVAQLVAAAEEDGFGSAPVNAFFCHSDNAALTSQMEAAVARACDVRRADRRDNGALTAVLMGGTGGAGFGLLPA